MAALPAAPPAQTTTIPASATRTRSPTTGVWRCSSAAPPIARCSATPGAGTDATGSAVAVQGPAPRTFAAAAGDGAARVFVVGGKQRALRRRRRRRQPRRGAASARRHLDLGRHALDRGHRRAADARAEAGAAWDPKRQAPRALRRLHLEGRRARAPRGHLGVQRRGVGALRDRRARRRGQASPWPSTRSSARSCSSAAPRRGTTPGSGTAPRGRKCRRRRRPRAATTRRSRPRSPAATSCASAAGTARRVPPTPGGCAAACGRRSRRTRRRRRATTPR